MLTDLKGLATMAALIVSVWWMIYGLTLVALVAWVRVADVLGMLAR